MRVLKPTEELTKRFEKKFGIGSIDNWVVTDKTVICGYLKIFRPRNELRLGTMKLPLKKENVECVKVFNDIGYSLNYIRRIAHLFHKRRYVRVSLYREKRDAPELLLISDEREDNNKIVLAPLLLDIYKFSREVDIVNLLVEEPPEEYWTIRLVSSIEQRY